MPSLLLVLFLFLLPQERVPWTGSRVKGSPEPPPPFRVEPLFPKLKFEAPVDLTYGPGRRLFVVTQNGPVFSIPEGFDGEKADLFIDVRKEILGLDKVPNCKWPGEVYALTFDPDFAKNRYCYLMYVLHSLDEKPLPTGSRVSRFTVTDADPPRADPKTEKLLVDWLSAGHNGCALKFGPDGMLYISTGDAASPNPPDPLATGQDISDLLSSILRIDVRREDAGKPYAVPADNPFVGLAGARPEVWSYGFRNPWRMSFDRQSGRLWVGDVGWELWEMVDCVERGSNFGWSITEGPQPVRPDRKRGPTPITAPALSLPHTEGASITGGFVYRGKKFPELLGHYVFGDWETRKIWAAKTDGAKLEPYREIARTELRIVGFAEDPDGELLVLDYEKLGVQRLAKAEASASNAAFPRKLSETGIFSSAAKHELAPGVIGYSVRAPMWSDGATGTRFLGMPGTSKLGWKDDKVTFPGDGLVGKTLSLEGRRVETQLLHFDGRAWNAYAYLWNEEQTDAELVGAKGVETTLKIGGRDRKWTVQGRATCLTCHNPWPGVALTLNAGQAPPGLLPPEAKGKPLADPYDEQAPIDARARAYLGVNCAHCHRFGGGGSALIDLRAEIPPKEMHLVDERPVLGAFELPDPALVRGGDPSRSVLYYRISKLGRGRMPHVGSETVDEVGVEVVARWIESLPGPKAEPCRAEDLDRQLSTTSGALAFLHARSALDSAVRAEGVKKGCAHPNELVRDLFERFTDPSQRRRRLGTSVDPASILALSGDASRGRRLFFESPGMQCRTCHRVGAGEDLLGPELTQIGKKSSRSQILESLLEPSKTIDPKYATWIVETTGGAILSGLKIREDATGLVLRDAERKDVVLPPGSIRRSVVQTRSLMPDFLLQDLSAQEAADLLEFLQALK